MESALRCKWKFGLTNWEYWFTISTWHRKPTLLFREKENGPLTLDHKTANTMTRVWKEKSTKIIIRKSLKNVTSARFDVLSINIVNSLFLLTRWFFQLTSFGRWKHISSEMAYICIVNRRVEKWRGVSWGSYWLLFSKVWCWASIGMGCKGGSRYFKKGRGTWQLEIIQFSQRKGVAAVPSADA